MLFNRENCFWSLTIGMERLEEYTKEESPFNKQENLRRDPIQEYLTTNSSELLQTVKDLKSEMESVKWEKKKDSASSGGAESNPNKKVSNWG